jgi:hypothetical protein
VTIKSTMTAMGYVQISTTSRACRECAQSEATARGRLHCNRGGFLVGPVGACKHFEKRAGGASSPTHAEPRKVQVGPTDI